MSWGVAPHHSTLQFPQQQNEGIKLLSMAPAGTTILGFSNFEVFIKYRASFTPSYQTSTQCLVSYLLLAFQELGNFLGPLFHEWGVPTLGGLKVATNSLQLLPLKAELFPTS